MPENKQNIKTEYRHSAGGVLIKAHQSRNMVCLIRPLGTDRWQLPKGMIEKTETAEEAAAREVYEETGCKGERGRFLEEIEYWYYQSNGGEKIRVHKTVTFYLFTYLEGDPRNKDSKEIKEARWFELKEGKSKLTYQNEKEVLAKACQVINE